MEKLNIADLLEKYNEGNCSPEELAFVENLLLEQNPTAVELTDIELNAAEERSILRGQEIPAVGAKKINWSLGTFLIAASIALVCGVWTIFFAREPTPGNYVTDINPGGNKALLTLESGKKIQLSDTKTGVVIDASKLSYNDGTLINNEASKTFTISTPRGGTYQVRLPDGSMVWLNAASSLTYRTALKEDGGIRRVKLTGEAYFEVAKDKEHPFVVSTDKQNVTVLGTHFNINSYTDEASVRTTLFEGSVRVAPLSSSGNPLLENAKILKPGTQAINSGNVIEIAPADADLAISWKNGEFAFKNETLEEIMKKVSRWYDVEVVFEDPKVKRKIFGGSISKFEKVSKVLGMLELTGDVKFKIDDKKILVTQ
ncbi:hypothetical protein AQ505_09780 [Pedobacter sp. PACM 27299]|uniref:FecR family protein n=1 Tax=Pedobacter sp. PACM 27299 TaxID=1727164 RepID=UPI000705CDB8|nr:FecR family protein [Pedobacter sp. PACM 27299]ALL05755.1 hypothetical protein AQ505_09780 [Pedobacter sp. PACM 27299]